MSGYFVFDPCRWLQQSRRVCPVQYASQFPQERNASHVCAKLGNISIALGKAESNEDLITSVGWRLAPHPWGQLRASRDFQWQTRKDLDVTRSCLNAPDWNPKSQDGSWVSSKLIHTELRQSWRIELRMHLAGARAVGHSPAGPSFPPSARKGWFKGAGGEVDWKWEPHSHQRGNATPWACAKPK